MLIRRLDDLGRIVIPREFRDQIGVGDGSPMSVSLSHGVIILDKVAEYKCPQCKSEYSIIEKFCPNCGEKVDKQTWLIKR